MRMSLRRLPLAAGLLVAALSCGDSPTGSGAPGPSGGPTGTREGEKLVLASGGTQLGVIGTRLSSPVVVRVLDARDQPVPDVAIDFAVTTGGGSVSPGQVRTDREGRAQALWTLGAAPGEQKLNVSGAGGSVVVAATAASSATATVLQKLSGDGFTAPPRSDLPLSVRAVDGSGNPVAGVAVAWSVEGGGSFSSASALTGADGTATARWTLGEAGAQRATVTVPGAPAAVFEATLAVPPAAVARVAVQPDSLALKAGATGRLSAVAYDAAGNVLTGRSVAWSSADAAIATAGADGTITAVAPGTTRATATVEGIAASAQVRVLSAEAVVARVVVQPDSLVLAPGSTGDLNAVAYDAQGNVLTGRAVIWTSSNAAVATLGTGGTVTAVAEGTADVTAKVDGISAVAKVRVRAPAPPPPAAVAAVRVEPDTLTLQVGATGQLRVVALDASGNVLMGRAATLVSSNTAIAALGTDGQVTGVAVGSATVTATVEGISGRATIKVQAAPPPPPAAVASVAIVPDTLTLQVGASAQLRVIARDAAGNELSGRMVTLVSSSTAIVALGSDGQVTGVAVGSAAVTATVEGVSGRATIKVQAAPPPPPAAVASVTIVPDTLTLQVGASAQLRVIARDAAGNELTGRTVTLVSSSTAIVTLGSDGRVTGAGEGSATITAAVEGATGRATIKVVAAPPPPPAAVASVTIVPDTLTLQVGASAQLRVIARDAAGNELSGRTVTLVSSNTAIVTLGSDGRVTGAGEGSATVTATVEGVTGRATIKVVAAPPPPAAVASVRVQPDSLTLTAGATATLTAAAYDAQGNLLTGRVVTWTSSNGAVVGFESGGTVRGIAAGTARVTATVEGVSASITVTVLAPRAVVKRVVVQPDSLVLAPGATGDLNVVAYDSAGNVVTGRAIVWASSSTGVATVGAGGAVTAVAAGTAQVSATVDGVSGSAKVIVRAGTYRAVASIRVWPDSLILDQGESRLISASTYDSNGNVSGRPVTYTSSNTAVAKLDANWKVVGVAPGTARIIASSEGVEAYIGVRVVAVPAGPSGGYTIEKISGDGQTAEFGQELPLQLMVRVLRAGYPVANAQVTWTADSGGGFIYTYPNTGLTDANGRATIKWYMGPKEGRQLATASVEGGGSVQFEATGVRAAYGGEVNAIQFNPRMTWLEPGMSSSLYGVALKDSKAARWAVLSWTIDNPDVLSVRIEPTGVSWSRVYFTALKPGEATFTATSGNLTKSITIKVFPPGTLGGGGGGGGSAIRAQP